MLPTAMHITPGTKGKRTRQSLQPLTVLPSLGSAAQAVLLKWLKSDAQERSWQSLLQAAGSSQLDAADTLLQALLGCGAVVLKEEFRNGQWRPWRVVWTDLEALQALLGLPGRTQREADKLSLNAQLQALVHEHPGLAAAAHSVMNEPLPAASRAARAELLQALVQWEQAQRQGLRQDFALAARGHTKSITKSEWEWLQATTPLEALGIGRFEPLLWLAGSIALCPVREEGAAALSLSGFGFAGLPCRNFAPPMHVARVPERYWLVENRASFERQAATLAPDCCLVWLPGRPGNAWMQAMRYLLRHAPAPARISCDPDPAGIQIAMTAGALWNEVNIPWQTSHMAPDDWCGAATLSLNDYDKRVLAELQVYPELPTALATLRDYLISSGTKAEQEGWL